MKLKRRILTSGVIILISGILAAFLSKLEIMQQIGEYTKHLAPIQYVIFIILWIPFTIIADKLWIMKEIKRKH